MKDIRLATDDNGHAKGYAFVEYTEAVCFVLSTWRSAR